ncbi:MAG: hypothetical protein WAK95_18915, partial [Desulfobacterales bacterium]
MGKDDMRLRVILLVLSLLALCRWKGPQLADDWRGMIKVLLADDHSIVRAGLRRLIEESGDMEVVAESADGREALR